MERLANRTKTANHNPPQVSIGVMIGRPKHTLLSRLTNAIAPGDDNAKHTRKYLVNWLRSIDTIDATTDLMI